MAHWPHARPHWSRQIKGADEARYAEPRSAARRGARASMGRLGRADEPAGATEAVTAVRANRMWGRDILRSCGLCVEFGQEALEGVTQRRTRVVSVVHGWL